MYCYNCGKEVSDDVAVCECGTPLSKSKKSGKAKELEAVGAPNRAKPVSGGTPKSFDLPKFKEFLSYIFGLSALGLAFLTAILIFMTSIAELASIFIPAVGVAITGIVFTFESNRETNPRYKVNSFLNIAALVVALSTLIFTVVL